MSGHSKKVAVCRPGRSSPGTESASIVTLDFPASRTMSNKVCCWNHPVMVVGYSNLSRHVQTYSVISTRQSWRRNSGTSYSICKLAAFSYACKWTAGTCAHIGTCSYIRLANWFDDKSKTMKSHLTAYSFSIRITLSKLSYTSWFKKRNRKFSSSQN